MVCLATTIAHCFEHSWKLLHTCFCGWNFEYSAKAKTTTIIHATLSKIQALRSLHICIHMDPHPGSFDAILDGCKSLHQVVVQPDISAHIRTLELSIPEHDHELHPDITNLSTLLSISNFRGELSALPTDIAHREQQAKETKMRIIKFYSGHGKIWLSKFPGSSASEIADLHALLITYTYLAMEFVLSRASCLIKFTYREPVREISPGSTVDPNSRLTHALRFPYLATDTKAGRDTPEEPRQFLSIRSPYAAKPDKCPSVPVAPGKSVPLPVKWFRYDNSLGLYATRNTDALILKSLLAYPLPSLQTLEIKLREKLSAQATQIDIGSTAPFFATFLEHCGQTIQQLRISGCIPSSRIFEPCPDLRLLHLPKGLSTWCNDSMDVFTCKPPHASLQKIHIGSPPIQFGRWRKDTPFVPSKFNSESLSSFADFPRLRLVHDDFVDGPRLGYVVSTFSIRQLPTMLR